MLALSVRQRYAEWILRGIKTVEYQEHARLVLILQSGLEALGGEFGALTETGNIAREKIGS